MSNGRGTVLVTGATGFTGGHLARNLAQRGWKVRALVRDTSKAINELIEHGIEPVKGDLTDRQAVLEAAAGVQDIYHIAAVYRSARHPDSYYWDVNVGGTQHVLDAARHHGVRRTVHCSTAGVHGEVSDIPATEDSAMNPGDIYQITKLEGERLASRAFADGVPGVVFRPVGIYGPGDLRFLKLFRTIAQRRFRMFGNGEVLYHLTYIDDLIDGIIRCGTHPNALGQVYLLAGCKYVTLNQMVALVANAVGVAPPKGRLPLWPLLAAATGCELACRMIRVEPPLHRRRVDFFQKDRAFSIDKAQRELGYQPQIDLPEGLSRTVAWYRNNGYLPRITVQANGQRDKVTTPEYSS